MPDRIVPPVIFVSSCAQVTDGPRAFATGCGIATTTGLDATDVPLSVIAVDALVSRCTHVDASGTQTSGTFVVPFGFPSPVTVVSCADAIAAATSDGCAAVTEMRTHAPSIVVFLAFHASASVCSAGAISGAAEIASGDVVPHADALWWWNQP